MAAGRPRVDYSKRSADIRQESLGRLRTEPAAARRQRRLLERWPATTPRRRCIVCAKPLRGQRFEHRGMAFVFCGTCGHLQSVAVAGRQARRPEFHTIYPALRASEYRARRDRIYTPKLEWIVRSLRAAGVSPARLRRLRWMEIGAGGGYFLSALARFGARDIAGFDGDAALVAMANDALGANRVVHEPEPSLSLALQRHAADIYVAFFVLEHVDDAHAVFAQWRRLPRGTIVVFSVPVFGFSVLLDGVFERNYARQLDGIVHTQLYTDDSIRYAMKVAGLRTVAEWIFGQDVDDLNRFLLQNLASRYPRPLLESVSRRLSGIHDDLQHVLDRSRLADQRHVIGIRR